MEFLQRRVISLRAASEECRTRLVTAPGHRALNTVLNANVYTAAVKRGVNAPHATPSMLRRKRCVNSRAETRKIRLRWRANERQNSLRKVGWLRLWSYRPRRQNRSRQRLLRLNRRDLAIDQLALRSIFAGRTKSLHIADPDIIIQARRGHQVLDSFH
jgi:hypothetical protein